MATVRNFKAASDKFNVWAKVPKFSPWKWRQYGPLKRWYPTNSVHSDTALKMNIQHHAKPQVSNLTEKIYA